MVERHQVAEAIALRAVAERFELHAMRDVDIGWFAAMTGFALSLAFILAVLAM